MTRLSFTLVLCSIALTANASPAAAQAPKLYYEIVIAEKVGGRCPVWEILRSQVVPVHEGADRLLLDNLKQRVKEIASPDHESISYDIVKAGRALLVYGYTKKRNGCTYTVYDYFIKKDQKLARAAFEGTKTGDGKNHFIELEWPRQ